MVIYCCVTVHPEPWVLACVPVASHTTRVPPETLVINRNLNVDLTVSADLVCFRRDG